MTAPASSDRPLVTFALLAYNQEEYVREAIEGAFAQTYEPLEIILSDDCSADRTFAIMQEMAAGYRGPHDVRTRRSSTNQGLAAHLNAVLAEANGKIISLAAGDDIALPNRTAKFVARINSSGECIAAHSPVVEIDLQGKVRGVRSSKRINIDYNPTDCAKFALSFASQSGAFRREAFDHFGPFETKLTHEGIALAFRCAALGRIDLVDEPLTKYRVGSGVSTYQGKDVRRLKVLEPSKISMWKLSATRQMLADVTRIEDCEIDELKRILIEREFELRNLYKINSEICSIGSLFKLLSRNPLCLVAVGHFVRRNIPVSIYTLFLAAKRRLAHGGGNRA